MSNGSFQKIWNYVISESIRGESIPQIQIIGSPPVLNAFREAILHSRQLNKSLNEGIIDQNEFSQYRYSVGVWERLTGLKWPV